MREALVLFGLTDRESNIYLSLLINGDSKASELARELGMHRLDVYNALKSLQSKDMVDSILSKPMMYKATPLDSVLVELKRKHREDISRTVAALANLEDATRRISQLSGRHQGEKRTSADKIQILSGNKAIKKKWGMLVAHARKEILIVATESGTTQTLFLGSVDTIYGKIKSGINVKVFTPVTSFNADRIGKIRRYVRHLSTSASAGLCISDRDKALMVIDQPEGVFSNSDAKTALMTDSKSIVEMLSTLFFVGWDTSPLFDEALETVNRGFHLPSRISNNPSAENYQG
jgi:sugar-specific transcriptional regulator TrmB